MSNKYKFINDSIAPIRITNASLNLVDTPVFNVNITQLNSNMYEAYVRYYPDLLAAYNADPNGRTITQFGEDHYRDNGAAEGRILFDSNDVRSYIGQQGMTTANAIYNITLADGVAHSSETSDKILELVNSWTIPGTYTTTLDQTGSDEYVFVVVGGGASGQGAPGDSGTTPGGSGGGAGGTGVYYMQGNQLSAEINVGTGGVNTSADGSTATPGGDTTVKFSDGVLLTGEGGKGKIAYTGTAAGGGATITGEHAARVPREFRRTIDSNFKAYTGGAGGPAGEPGRNEPGEKGGGVPVVAPVVRITARGVSRDASGTSSGLQGKSFSYQKQYTHITDQEFDVSLTWPEQTGVMINLDWYDVSGSRYNTRNNHGVYYLREERTNNPILVTLQSDGKIVSNLGDQSYNGAAALSDVVIRVDDVVVYEQTASGAAQTGVLADVSTYTTPGELYTHQATGGAGGVANSNYYDSPGGGGGNIGYNISDIPALHKIDHAERILGSGGKGGDGNQPPQPDTAIRITGTARDYYVERRAGKGYNPVVGGTTSIYTVLEERESNVSDFDETINWPSQAGQAIVSRTYTTKTFNNRTKTFLTRAFDFPTNLEIDNAGILKSSRSGWLFANIKVYIDGELVYEQPDSEDYTSNPTYVDVSSIIQPGGFTGIGEPATGVGNGGGGTGANTSITDYKPGGDGADGGVFLYRVNRKHFTGYNSVVSIHSLPEGSKVNFQVLGDVPQQTHLDYSVVYCDQPIAISVTDKLGADRSATGTTYTHVTGSYTFEQAREDAIIRGGELAQFKTSGELAAFNDYLTTIPGYGGGWIGLTDTQSEGTWRWLDGTVASSDTLNWYSGEPNNGGGIEDYTNVIEAWGGKWNDWYDNVNSYFMQTTASQNRNVLLVTANHPTDTPVFVDNTGDGVYDYYCSLYSTPGELKQYNPFKASQPVAVVTSGGASFNTQNGTLAAGQELDIDIQFPVGMPTTEFVIGSEDNLKLSIDWLCPATGNSRQDMSLEFPVSYISAPRLATPVDTVYMCWAGVNGVPVEMKLKTKQSFTTYGPYASTQGQYYEGDGYYDGRSGQWQLKPHLDGDDQQQEADTYVTWGLFFKSQVNGKNLTLGVLTYTGDLTNQSFINEYSYYIGSKEINQSWEPMSIVGENENAYIDLDMMMCFHKPVDHNLQNSSANVDIVQDYRVFNRVDKNANILQLEWDKKNTSKSVDVVYFIDYQTTSGINNHYVIPDILNEDQCTYQVRTQDDLTKGQVVLTTNTSDRQTGALRTSNAVTLTPVSLAYWNLNSYKNYLRLSTLPIVNFDYQKTSGSMKITAPTSTALYDPVTDTWQSQYKDMAPSGMTIRLHATDKINWFGGPDTALDVKHVASMDTPTNEYTFKNLPGFFAGGVINVDLVLGNSTRTYQIAGLGAPGAAVRITGSGYTSHGGKKSSYQTGPDPFDAQFQWPIQSGTAATYQWNTTRRWVHTGHHRSNWGCKGSACWIRSKNQTTLTLQPDGKIVSNNNLAKLFDIKVYVDDQLIYEQPAGDTSTSFADVSQYVQD